MVDLIARLELAGQAAIVVADKPWMLAAKMVDELIEPAMLARGMQMVWYQSGAARVMAELLAKLGPKELDDTYDEFARAFVRLVRRYTPERAEEFQRTLGRCKIVCRSRPLRRLLDEMIDGSDELAACFMATTDALDPALMALFFQAGFWSSTLGATFEIVHDESTTVRRWAKLFDDMRASRLAAEEASGQLTPEFAQIGAIRLDIPVHLMEITFAESHRDASVQLTDVLAGAAAYVYARRFDYRPPDAFSDALMQVGVADLTIEMIASKA